MKDYPTEPYDPQTPRLEFDDVAALVARLPESAVLALREGPVSEDACLPCGVCLALEGVDTDEARALMRWHDKLAYSEEFKRIIRARFMDGTHPAFDDVCEELRAKLGTTMHARCTTIYFAARFEVLRRRGG